MQPNPLRDWPAIRSFSEVWRRHSDSNRGSGICSPMPYHLAMPPLVEEFIPEPVPVPLIGHGKPS